MLASIFFLVLGSEWSGSILFFVMGDEEIFLEVMVTDER